MRIVRRLAFLGVMVNAFGRGWAWLRGKSKKSGMAPRAKWFARGEIREIRELFTGQEGWRQYCHDSYALLHDFFIPHRGNDHRPHALRPRSLTMYLVAALLVKVVVSGALFLSYPTPARLARIVAKEIVGLTNQARIAVGLPALRIDPVLAASAQAKGADMVSRDYFAHDTPEGRKPWSWINRTQYDYVYAGENLAIDFTSAEAVHEAFMNSPSHRANILNSHYEDIGVAVISGTMAGHQTELLVQFFGSRREDALPVAAVPQRTPVPAATVAPRATPIAYASPSASRPAAVPAGVATPGAPQPTVTPAEEPSASPTLTPEAETVPPEMLNPVVSNEPILVLGAQSSTGDPLELVLRFSNFFLVALVVFLAIALLLNIFVRIRIQHPDVILQSMAVIALIVALLLTKIHFIERIGHELRIL
ncbi:MAG: CAP domain-containing protein [Patescibacteria group bacterium]|nr:CAP domain-containing protein [Patescibacteria group bacterium]